MDIIYVDSLFFLNLTIDYLLLLATAKICSLPLRRLRFAAAAALGGLYAVAAVLQPELFALPTVKILMGALLCVAAFGAKHRFGAALGSFFAVSAAFGGAVYAAGTLGSYPHSGKSFIPVSGKVLFLSFALCYAALTLLFRRSGKRLQRKIHKAEIGLKSRHISVNALADTGNELSDPVSGEKVLVCEASALASLLEKGGELLSGDALESFEALAALPEFQGRLRLLPCSCAAARSSLLLCFRPDSLSIDGERHRGSVAVCANTLSSDGEFQALW